MIKKHIYYMLLLLISIYPLTAKATSVQPFLDLLAWRASESTGGWATTLTFPGNSTIVNQNNINSNTRLGMKAGVLYAPEGNFWDTKFYWTYFPASSTKTIPVGNKLVTSLFFSGSFFISKNIFFGGSADWQLDMNTIDLEASHAFKPIPTLTFTPKVGIKSASINQEIDATWDAIIYTANEDVTNNFIGIGPSFGLDTKWNVYQNFSLIGDISTALMYGRWNGKDVYHRPPALSGIIPPTTITTSMNQSKLGAMMMDYYLGLEWVHQGRSRVAVNLGYEMQYWAGQLRLIAIQQFPPLGDLTLQGATCGITIDL